jgi:hypothetical protein
VNAGVKYRRPHDDNLAKSLAISGALAIASATLVTGPTGQSVISPGFSFAMRMMRSLACSSVGLIVGSGSSMSPIAFCP